MKNQTGELVIVPSLIFLYKKEKLTYQEQRRETNE
ncbi:hypothetical protein ZYGNAAKF_CDS0031 [Enterococcus phage VRE9_2]